MTPAGVFDLQLRWNRFWEPKATAAPDIPAYESTWTTRAAAASMLRRAVITSGAAPLRRLLTEAPAVPNVAALDDDEVVEMLAGRVASGELLLLTPRREPVTRITRPRVAPPPEELAPQVVEEETTWIEVQLVDMDCEPIPNERYRIALPNGGVEEGRLDYRGRGRVRNIDTAGNCQITFPDLDQDAWRSQVICPTPTMLPQFTFIEYELVDMAGDPVPGEPYRITLANGEIIEGVLDKAGRVRLDLVLPGDCQITFPNLDSEAWKGV